MAGELRKSAPLVMASARFELSCSKWNSRNHEAGLGRFPSLPSISPGRSWRCRGLPKRRRSRLVYCGTALFSACAMPTNPLIQSAFLARNISASLGYRLDQVMTAHRLIYAPMVASDGTSKPVSHISDDGDFHLLSLSNFLASSFL